MANEIKAWVFLSKSRSGHFREGHGGHRSRLFLPRRMQGAVSLLLLKMKPRKLYLQHQLYNNKHITSIKMDEMGSISIPRDDFDTLIRRYEY